MPEKVDRSISIIWANILSIIFAIPVLLIYLSAFILIHGFENLNLSFVVYWDSVLVFLVIFLIGIALHELLHGLTWQCLSGQWDAVEYGVKWQLLTPYAHLKTRIPVSVYRVGIWMPGVVVGVLPSIVALIIGHVPLLWFGILFTWGAGGDALILWILRDVPNNAEIEDHPSRVGCFVHLPDESTQ